MDYWPVVAFGAVAAGAIILPRCAWVRRVARTAVLACVDIYSSAEVRGREYAKTAVGSILVKLDNVVDRRYSSMLEADEYAARTQKIISANYRGINVTLALKHFLSMDDAPSCTGAMDYLQTILPVESGSDAPLILHLIYDDCGDLFISRYNLSAGIEILSGREIPFGDLSVLTGVGLVESTTADDMCETILQC